MNRSSDRLLFLITGFVSSCKGNLNKQPSSPLSMLCNCSHPDVEVSIFITRADAEGVVSPRRDAGGLDLEDVRGDGALWGDAHVAVDDGERQISAGGLVDGTHTAAGHTHRGVNKEGTGKCINTWCRWPLTVVHKSASRGSNMTKRRVLLKSKQILNRSHFSLVFF